MFNWLLFPRENNIPEPPKNNLELAKQIRARRYDSTHYYHPLELVDEINSLRQDYIPVTTVLDDSEHYYKPRDFVSIEVQDLVSGKINNLISSEEETDSDSSTESVGDFPPSNMATSNFDSINVDSHEEDNEEAEAQEQEAEAQEQNEISKHIDKVIAEQEFEVIDWDKKIKEWGEFVGPNTIDWNTGYDINWTENPSFHFNNTADKVIEDLEIGYLNCNTDISVFDEEQEQEQETETQTEVNEEDIRKISESISQDWIPTWIDEVNMICNSSNDICETHRETNHKENVTTSKMAELQVHKNEKREGYLELNIGPMFSGKSSKILFKLTSMADQRFKCLYVNSLKDVRVTEAQDDIATTHNSSYSKLSTKIDRIKVDKLLDVDVSNYDYIAVDEVQFFQDSYETIISWVEIGKYVIVASLDGDCYRRKFGSVLDLIPHADEVHKLTAYCAMCRDNYGILKKAPFTARMTSDRSSELVGGADLYKPMCRSCHDFHIDTTVSYC